MSRPEDVPIPESEATQDTRLERPQPEILLGRALRLRCPRCGKGKLFVSFFKMPNRCPECNFRIAREPGYYLGSTYINYGITALILTIAVLGSFIVAHLTPDKIIWPLAIFCLTFPLIIFRHSRALWLALDCHFDQSLMNEE